MGIKSESMPTDPRGEVGISHAAIMYIFIIYIANPLRPKALHLITL